MAIENEVWGCSFHRGSDRVRVRSAIKLVAKELIALENGIHLGIAVILIDATLDKFEFELVHPPG